MTGTKDAQPTREERLAAKLRENLRRRKTQGRQLSLGRPEDNTQSTDGKSPGETLPNPPQGS